MFGTKKIYCKIMNGKLVVRVGGGFMGIEDFINQYAAIEIEKTSMESVGNLLTTKGSGNALLSGKRSSGASSVSAKQMV